MEEVRKRPPKYEKEFVVYWDYVLEIYKRIRDV
jgi:hypothetical protein